MEREFVEATDRAIARLVVVLASFFVVLKVIYIALHVEFTDQLQP
jgi:hypothetical protein